MTQGCRVWRVWGGGGGTTWCGRPPRPGKPAAGDLVVVWGPEWLWPSRTDRKRGFRRPGGGSSCVKLPSRRRSGGALIALSCPTMPARLPVDRWDL